MEDEEKKVIKYKRKTIKKKNKKGIKVYYLFYQKNYFLFLCIFSILLLITIIIKLIYSKYNQLVRFLKYKKEIELKNERFEKYSFITVDIVKNILTEMKLNNNYKFNNTMILNNSVINSSLHSLDMDKISEYILNLLNEPFSIDNLKNYIFNLNPKISIIITVYNSEKYIPNIQRSIQNQSFEDIEIIYVDDFSTDNTSQLIKSFQEIDQRIIYLKNKENKGPFYSRNKGALFARGEYLQFVDGDDLLVNNNLERTYRIAKDKNVDMVQYAVIRGTNSFSYINEKYGKSLILQPELSDQMFYGMGYLKQANLYLINKLIVIIIFLIN